MHITTNEIIQRFAEAQQLIDYFGFGTLLLLFSFLLLEAASRRSNAVAESELD